ncbi:DNA repair helicase rad25 [Halogeometricum borinquense DSM 11551]|uniref:DNA 3'-5' helicase n=1 Tax=Halogeometricum borinquense (strain ATCC 700274 / DSM 11551 / JCM 10706 / KCTC 4070 / PR3) TaxID=469382 RepID=E4NL35_HALBP|nr:DEAD/DEAH box helicase family protein [Halogeometricum borinquense]ADQ67187.1 DNA repair helicase RAD25 [Halogeometricum borinquense DSM 11551]ELY29734.1 DNA repair helicase rad25 [Halogeometricum borinquense DSM 11551]
MLTLTFEDGTVRVGGLAESDVSAADLPGVAWDDRGLVARAPAYRYADLRASLDERGLDYEDRIRPETNLNLSHAYDLRDYQRGALDAWHANDERGVLELPTGAGKTVVAVAAIAALGGSTLIVVPTVDLLNQWRRELETEFDISVGQFGGGEQTQEAITVSTYDSAYLRADDVGGDFEFVVFDEVHHLGGEGYRDVARLLTAPARLGLTATFERPDGAHEVIADLVGPKVYDLSVDDLAGDHLAEYEVRRIEVDLTPAERERYEEAQGTFVDYLKTSNLSFRSGSDYQKLVMRSGTDPRAREALLAKQRARRIMMNADQKVETLGRILDRHCDDRVIVFTAHTDLVYRLSERYLLPAITSETAASDRRELLERFRDGTYSRVVTANVLDEGVDVPDANVAVLLAGSGSEREFTQRLGRVLRPKTDGGAAILYELVSAETAEERVAQRRR